MRRILFGFTLLAATAIAGCGSGGVEPFKSALLPIHEALPPSPITPVVIIMQENRSFDNLFNGFPGADTVRTGAHYGKVVPLTPLGIGVPLEMINSHTEWWKDWNHGMLDGFNNQA